MYSAYKELLRWKPSLRKVFESETDLRHLEELYKEVITTVLIVLQVNIGN